MLNTFILICVFFSSCELVLAVIWNFINRFCRFEDNNDENQDLYSLSVGTFFRKDSRCLEVVRLGGNDHHLLLQFHGCIGSSAAEVHVIKYIYMYIYIYMCVCPVLLNQTSFMVDVCVISQYSLILALYANNITSYMKMETMVISATCFNVLSKLLKKNRFNRTWKYYHTNITNYKICCNLA